MIVPYDIRTNVVWRGVQQATAAIDAVATGRQMICLVGSGTGIGKTYLAQKGCKRRGVKHPVELGPINEHALVKSYWQHRAEPVLLLDEAERMWKQPAVSNLLKLAYGGDGRHLLVGTVEAQQNEQHRLAEDPKYDPDIPPPKFLLHDRCRGIGLTNTNFADPRVVAALPAPEHFRALVGRGLDPIWIPDDHEHDGLDLFLYTHHLATCDNMLRARQCTYEVARSAVAFFVTYANRLIDLHPRRLCLIAEAFTWPIAERDMRLEGMLRAEDARPKLRIPTGWVAMQHGEASLLWPHEKAPRRNPPPTHASPEPAPRVTST